MHLVHFNYWRYTLPVIKKKSIFPNPSLNILALSKPTQLLTPNQQTGAWNISMRLKNNNKLTDHERIMGLKIWEMVIEHAPKLLFDNN